MPDPTFTLRLPVRWADQDELGHVNNAVYMTFFEQARIEYLQGLAEGDAPWPGPLTEGPVLVAADVQFRRPVTYPATVVVEVTARPPGRSSLGLDCRLTVVGDEATTYAEARTTLVWVDRKAGRPTPLPDDLRQGATVG